MQVLSKRYFKNHSEVLKDTPVTKDKEPPRGGAIIEISMISIKVVAKIVLNFLAKKRLMAGLLTSRH